LVVTERFHKESHQYLDLISLYRPAVKWNAQLVRPQVVPEAVRKAFKVAQPEKPGATHLDFPEDVAEAAACLGLEPLTPQQAFPTEPSDQQIERAAKIISEARSPIVLAGNGIARGRASEALRRFAETLGIPVVETFMGKGSLPDTHPLCLGTVGLQEHDYVSCGLDRADVVICVGYDLVEYAPARWTRGMTSVSSTSIRRRPRSMLPITALGSDGAPSCTVASAYSNLSSLSVGTLWRHYLRQEPDAVILHVRIRGGGYGQP
jgi:acetolactate synthase I/II/III large subunit